MSNENPRSRLPMVLGGLFVLAVVTTIVLFVFVRLRLSPEERMFVGTWRIDVDGEPNSVVRFRDDRFGVSHGHPIAWHVHGTDLVAGPREEVPAWRTFWDRLVGVVPDGESYDVDVLTDDRIVLSSVNGTIELTRIDGSASREVE
jgi:hypothetical protein